MGDKGKQPMKKLAVGKSKMASGGKTNISFP